MGNERIDVSFYLIVFPETRQIGVIGCHYLPTLALFEPVDAHRRRQTVSGEAVDAPRRCQTVSGEVFRDAIGSAESSISSRLKYCISQISGVYWQKKEAVHAPPLQNIA